jgi:serine O-acetyltransferase
MNDGRARARRIAQVLRMSRYAPLLLLRSVSPARGVVDADVARWIDVVAPEPVPRRRLLWLLARYPEFRTLYYYRMRRASVAGGALAAIAAALFPGERTLHLTSSEIGPGLFIQHGFATVVSAARVGSRCWINQQVTVGFDRGGARPVIGDRVTIGAGAKVLGAVHVGDGARIGANAVVLTDVPAGYTAVGVPARLLPPKAEREPT